MLSASLTASPVSAVSVVGESVQLVCPCQQLQHWQWVPSHCLYRQHTRGREGGRGQSVRMSCAAFEG